MTHDGAFASLFTRAPARPHPGARRRPHLGSRRRVRGQLEPVTGRPHGHAQGGLDHRSRQPQPVRGHRTVQLRAVPRELRLPDRLRRQVPGDPAGARRELDQERRRTHLDVQDPPGGHVERRPASDGPRHRLQLHVPEEARTDRLPLGAGRHQVGHGARRHDRRHPVQPAQGGHPLDVGAGRAGAHLEPVQDLRAGDQVPQLAADRRFGAVPGGRVAEGQVHPRRGQQGLLGWQAQGRRDPLRCLQEPGHAGDGPQARRDRPRDQHPARPGEGAAG